MQETQETQVQSLGQEDPWRRKWQPTPVFLPWESHGQRSLVGCSLKDRKELDTTEQLSTSLRKKEEVEEKEEEDEGEKEREKNILEARCQMDEW